MIPVIQTSIVGTKHVNVLSSQDVKSAGFLGDQVTPQDLSYITNYSVMDNIISSTITGKLSDKQPFLWSTNSPNITSVDANITDSSSFNNIPKVQFIATFPVGTDTGVLRELALRLNMSVSCSLVPQSDFPSTCPGHVPLYQTFSNIKSSTSGPFGDLSNPRYHAQMCAPGNTRLSPWNNTSDRQDITEEFWLDYQQTPHDGIWGNRDESSNYTQNCYGNSTLGYFELPNYWNGHVAGPLLDKVPPNEPNPTYRNPYSLQVADSLPLGPGPRGEGVSGPFLTAIMAIFGPNTFFTTAAANSNATRSSVTLPLCDQLRYPFTSLAHEDSPPESGGDFLIDWAPKYPRLACDFSKEGASDPAHPLLRALMRWLPSFGNHDKATAALTLATYAAANAILNVGPSLEGSYGSSLYTSPGTSIQKPNISFPGMVIVSLLLAVQIIGLTLMAVYASRKVTWTAALDSWAMLRLGAEIGRGNLPAVSAFEAKRAGVLDAQKGWVGDLGVEGREGEVELRELGLGGVEGVRGGTLYRIVKGEGGDG